MTNFWASGESWHISRDRFGVTILRQRDGSPFPDRSPEAIEARDAVVEAAPVLLAVCEAFVAPTQGLPDLYFQTRIERSKHATRIEEARTILAMRAAIRLARGG